MRTWSCSCSAGVSTALGRTRYQQHPKAGGAASWDGGGSVPFGVCVSYALGALDLSLPPPGTDPKPARCLPAPLSSPGASSSSTEQRSPGLPQPQVRFLELQKIASTSSSSINKYGLGLWYISGGDLHVLQGVSLASCKHRPFPQQLVQPRAAGAPLPALLCRVLGPVSLLLSAVPPAA